MFYISLSPYISLIFLYKQKQLIMLLRGKQLLLHYTVFYICFSNFPPLLYFSESANVLSVGWSCHYHHVRTELVIHISLPASTLMYVLITFFTKIVSILKRCWNLRQVINFEYKLCSVSRQILRVDIKYKIILPNISNLDRKLLEVLMDKMDPSIILI